MATVTVNGSDVEIGDQEKLNLVQVAKRAEVEIPHYCWHHELSVVASCRMCLVEIGEKKPDGTVAMQPKLFPACQTPAKNGTVVVTDSPKVKQAQAGTLEYLLLNHPLDCPICDQAGECFLQDYSFRYGNSQSRLNEPKIQRIDKDHIGENIKLFTDRCVMCSRCVRFTREVSGTGELQVINRGSHAEIDIFPGEPCNNKLAGNVVDLCPVGALCSKDFLYKQRVWWLKTKKSVCSGCSTGCSVYIDENEDRIYRLRPRENPQAQGSFMCDEGRFGFKYVHSDNRLTAPTRKVSGNGQSVGAAVVPDWTSILSSLKADLANLAKSEQPGLAAVLSPMMTCEEAYLLATLMKGLSKSAKLYLGPVPMVGEDDQYPKGPNGRPVAPVRFTIRAEKCPNRKGVEAVLKHFEGSVRNFDAALADAQSGSMKAAWIVGGYPDSWLSEENAKAFAKLSFLVVQDIFASSLSANANYVLAAAASYEKDGTFVNHAGLAQQMKWGVKPPGEARQDGRVFNDLLGREGLYHPQSIRQEMGQAIAEFANFGDGDLGEFGVMLQSKTAATTAS